MTTTKIVNGSPLCFMGNVPGAIATTAWPWRPRLAVV